MIDLYTFTTPNGRKASIMLEELGLDYETHIIHIGKDEQFAPAFLKISPNNKIPAIVDQHAKGGPRSVFESGAILIYLAEKTGSSLLPAEGPERTAVLEWLMFQMASVGPMFGQMGHFLALTGEDVPYAMDRYTKETERLLGVMDKQLADNDYLAGDAYTIADIATYPWVREGLDFYRNNLKRGQVPETPANVAAWLERVGKREAVKKGMAVPQL